MDREINWAALWSGLGAVAVVAIVGVLLAAGGNGVWLVAFLPIAAVAAGAILVAGRDPLA